MNHICLVCGDFYSSIRYEIKIDNKWVTVCENHEHSSNCKLVLALQEIGENHE